MTSREPIVLVVMGVSGSGKTTVARRLSSELGWPFQEGDELHPPSNIAKMAAGTPLDDEDRAPWLAAVADWIGTQLAVGGSGVITCSALRRRYRDVLRAPGVVFVYLEAPQHSIQHRLAARTGHFMPPTLLGSQVEALEPPGRDERSITVDALQAPDRQVAAVLAGLATPTR